MGKGKNRRDRSNKKYFFMGGNNAGTKKEKSEKTEPKQHEKKTIGPKDSSSSWSSSNWSSSSSPSAQPVQNRENVILTDKGAYEFVHSAAWGTVLVPVNDPNTKVSYDEINGIKLVDNFPKIPADLWARWISLCFHLCPEKGASSGVSSTSSSSPIVHQRWNQESQKYDYYKYVDGKEVSATKEEWEAKGPTTTTPVGGYNNCHSGELEVSMLLLRKRDDLTQWRILVPKQVVTGASVNADLSETIDIVTGERFNAFPPVGWVHAGSSHSHNTMGAFFSSTDDKSELTVPGLHVVVGRIDKKEMTYEYKASIVMRQMRRNIDLLDVVDARPVEDMRFHADVLELIKVNKPTYSYTGPSSYSGPSKSNYREDREGGWGAWGWGDFDDEGPPRRSAAASAHSQDSFPSEKRPYTLHDLCGEYYGDDDGDDAVHFSVSPAKATDPSKTSDSNKAENNKPTTPELNPSSKKTLEELERALERAIDGFGDLDLNDIMAYYEKVGMPYNPGEWSGL